MRELLRRLLTGSPAVHKYRDGYAIAYYDPHRRCYVAPQLIYTGGPSAYVGERLADVLPCAARYRTRKVACAVARRIGR